MNDDPISDAEWLARKKATVSGDESERAMGLERSQLLDDQDRRMALAIRKQEAKKKASDLTEITGIAVCLEDQVPYRSATGIILKRIWLYTERGNRAMKIVILDPDGMEHGYEGLLEDFIGCRNADDIMIRALGG